MATEQDYRRLDLRAHSLLADVPLHDVWHVDLPGGGAGRTVLDLRTLLPVGELTADLPVRFLFRFRALLGRRFGWDREPPQASRETYLHRLSPADRESSLVPPGSSIGRFRVLFVSPREAILETRNATVHGFVVVALLETKSGYDLYSGIYVRPVGRFTAWYMRLIDPFRRLIIYPAILRRVRAAWIQP
jgi:hypothetical protein